MWVPHSSGRITGPVGLVCPACGFEKHALVGKRTSSWASNLMPLAAQTFRPHPRSAPCLEMAPPEHFDEQIEIKKDCASMDARFGRIGGLQGSPREGPESVSEPPFDRGA
jgi:hypothetical protein